MGSKLTEHVFDTQFARMYENFSINRMSPQKVGCIETKNAIMEPCQEILGITYYFYCYMGH